MFGLIRPTWFGPRRLRFFAGGIVWDHGLYPFGPSFSRKTAPFSSRFSPHDSATRAVTLEFAFQTLLLERCEFERDGFAFTV